MAASDSIRKERILKMYCNYRQRQFSAHNHHFVVVPFILHSIVPPLRRICDGTFKNDTSYLQPLQEPEYISLALELTTSVAKAHTVSAAVTGRGRTRASAVSSHCESVEGRNFEKFRRWEWNVSLRRFFLRSDIEQYVPGRCLFLYRLSCVVCAARFVRCRHFSPRLRQRGGGEVAS